MIIKRLSIKNFRSYYGDNSFEFKDGLTLLIGGNGDGKTTFFDALDWFFKTATNDLLVKNISEKRVDELEIGESDEVRVSMIFDHDGEKELEKSFIFEKRKEGVLPKDFFFKGYETKGSERVPVQGNSLLERCFDTVIRKYCLFKGESELNVFEDPTALKVLVETFSDVKRFDKYVTFSEYCDKQSDTAYKRELKNDKQLSKKASELEKRSEEANREIDFLCKDIKKQEKVTSDCQIRLDNLEQHQETSEKYTTLKNRLKNLNDEKTRLKAKIDTNYNERLLDDYWILCAFPPVVKEFRKKISFFSREKRKQNEIYIEKRGKEKGKQEIIEELKGLANGTTHLPWNLPDVSTMEEMVEDEVCKVCGRPAPKGSEAYEFMSSKLNLYIQKTEEQNTKIEEEESLFHNDYIEELRSLSSRFSGDTEKRINNIKLEIKNDIDFISRRREELKAVEESIQDTKEEKERLLIQSNYISEELLDKNFKDLKGLFEVKERAEKRIVEYKIKLEEWEKVKEEIEKEYEKLTPKKGCVNRYAGIHTAFHKIQNAFLEAKKANLRRFLGDLQESANHYLQQLNIDDFHGEIRISETVNASARISLYSSNDSIIYEPNGALKTTMYMSVLLAISDLTTLKRDSDYPLIFDAPTSSFETFKEEEFYNIIDKIKKQCIIATKDFLDKDHITGERKLNLKKVQDLTCSVYRIEKKRPFTPNDLSTIQTVSQQIK